MCEKEKPTKQEVETAAQTLFSIRMMLETVPMEILEGALEGAATKRTRYMTLQPLLDPTDYQRHGAEKEDSLEAMGDAANALLKLKRIWRQDVPLDERIREEMEDGSSIDERIQEELDRCAPKGGDEEPEDAEWLRGRDARAGR